MQFETIYHVILLVYTALYVFLLLHHSVHFFLSREKGLYALLMCTMASLLAYSWLDIPMFSQTPDPHPQAAVLIRLTYVISCFFCGLWLTLLSKLLQERMKIILAAIWTLTGLALVLSPTRLLFSDSVEAVYNSFGQCWYVKPPFTTLGSIMSAAIVGCVAVALFTVTLGWRKMGWGNRFFLLACWVTFFLMVLDILVFMTIVDLPFLWNIACAFFALGVSLRLSGRHYELTLELEDARDELRQFNEKTVVMQRLSTMGVIVRGIVHDMKNYFSAMGPATELGELMLRRGDVAEANHYFQEIRGSANDAQNYLKRMLAMTEGAERVVREPVNLAALVEQMVRVSGLRIQQSPIQVEVNIPGELTVMTDPRLLQQIMLNLIFNAVKALPAAPARRALSFAAHIEGSMPMLAVEDSGPGLPEWARQRLKETNSGLDVAAKGIGLRQIKENCRLLGVALSYICAPGRGTCFRLVFSSP